jgi:O-antigen/teichoic acid export membrane protein
MKAMGIFGGVQMLSIICSIVRTKLVAIWIGPMGVGLFGLYNSALDMINTISGLGIRNSSVRDISLAHGNGESSLIARMVAVVRRWSLFLGLAGALLTLCASPALSRIVFGDFDHIWGFVALSVAVLIFSLTNGEFSILNGTAKLRRLASATVWGVASGLVISIPLYYFLRVNSIVPAIIAYTASCGFFAWLFRNKDYSKEPVNMSARETFDMGKGFARLGIFMTLSTFVSQISSFIFMAYLNHTASTETVGFYKAGYTIVDQYGGLIFSAIGVEYYPRLVQLCRSKMRLRIFVSQEINILLLVLVPCISLFLIFRSLVVSILYSGKFMVIVPFISWAIMGTIFRAVSWCIAFVILAKGSGKIYLITETLSAISGLVFNIVFYQLWGLEGFGIAFIAWYVLYTVIVGFVYYRTYHLHLHRSIAYSTSAAVVCSVAIFLAMNTGMIAVAVIISVATIVFCLVRLRKMLA